MIWKRRGEYDFKILQAESEFKSVNKNVTIIYW